MLSWSDEVQHEVKAGVGLITLARPKALNALSLPMIRELTAVLQRWADDPTVLAVAIRGSDKHGPFGAFCAGGDIRFFHQAAHAGDAQLEDFFTEEYHLNHLIHRYPKPYIAFMDGIVMGGGMGLSQGARLRIVTDRTQMAMPETLIGLFPDVGGGYFLSRCPGHAGEYLALTGRSLHGAQALHFGLADVCADHTQLDALWQGLAASSWQDGESLVQWVRSQIPYTSTQPPDWWHAELDALFGLPTLQEIVRTLEQAVEPWAVEVLSALRQRSPLMLHVSLAQIRRGRQHTLADDLRMERDMVHHCFHAQHLQRRAGETETVEGIRALAVDKDRQPRWNPARIEDVTPEMVEGYFVSPWPEALHPLRHLKD